MVGGRNSPPEQLRKKQIVWGREKRKETVGTLKKGVKKTTISDTQEKKGRRELGWKRENMEDKNTSQIQGLERGIGQSREKRGEDGKGRGPEPHGRDDEDS